jgi:N-acetylmuramoyl-L-alanine amidase
MGNRKPGVFDCGAVGVNGEKEADWTLRYGRSIALNLTDMGAEAYLTRENNTVPCSLAWRVRTAMRMQAALLLSVHFNADAIPGISAPDGKVKGFMVLWNTPSSEPFAKAVLERAAMDRIKKCGAGLVRRSDLCVLRYDPSVLIEFGFLDDPEDFALIRNADWQASVCLAVAEAVIQTLEAIKNGTVLPPA